MFKNQAFLTVLFVLLLLCNEHDRAAVAAVTKSLCEKRYHDRAFAYNTTIKFKNVEREN